MILLKLKILYIALVLILIPMNSSVQGGQLMTLEDCIAAGIKNNSKLEAYRHSLTAAEYGVKSAAADFLPSVSSSYNINRIASEKSIGPTEADYLDQDVHTFNIKLTQILFAGFRILNTYQKATAREKMAIADMNLEELNLIYKIKTNFFRLMKARQDVDMLAKSINRLNENIKAVEMFFEKELISYADVLQAKVDLSNAKEQLGIAENNVRRERAGLFFLMGQPMETDMEFAGGLYAMGLEKFHYDTLVATAVKQRPDIKSLEFQREMVRKDEAIALGGYFPVIQAEVGYTDQDRDYEELATSLFGTTDRDQRNSYWSAGIYATWKLFDGGHSWFEKKRLNSEVQKIDSLIKEAVNNISTGIQKALFSISDAEQRFQSTGETIKLSEEFYTNEEHRLKAGVTTIPNLLKANERLMQAKASQATAVLDYYLAKAELQLITGE